MISEFIPTVFEGNPARFFHGRDIMLIPNFLARSRKDLPHHAMQREADNVVTMPISVDEHLLDLRLEVDFHSVIFHCSPVLDVSKAKVNFYVLIKTRFCVHFYTKLVTMNNRPTLIDIGTKAAGTTFGGITLRIRKKMPDGSEMIEPLDNLTFRAFWRRDSDSGTLVKEDILEKVGPDMVILPSFGLFATPGIYFLTILSFSEGGDKFEIYRGKIQVAPSPAS